MRGQSRRRGRYSLRDEKRSNRWRVNLVDFDGNLHSLLVDGVSPEDAIAAVRRRSRGVFRILSVIDVSTRFGPYAAGYVGETPEAEHARARLRSRQSR